MIVDKLKEILDNLVSLEEDAQKCESGNASAGRRVRKACLEASKELKELRSLILEHSKK